MRLARVFLGAPLACFLLPGTVLAQQNYVAPEVRQPASAIQQTSVDFDAYTYADPAAPSPSPSDAPAVAADQIDAAPVYYSAPRRPSRMCRNGALADPWTLFPEFSSGLKLGGWASAGVYSNAYGSANNGPIAFRDLSDFTFDQLWVFAEKATDTSEKPIDWGFRFDFIYGADGQDTQAFANSQWGWDNGWDGDNGYGSAIPQLYFELAIGDLSVKAGHFYTLIGYEVVPAPDNFFYSHAYTMNFGEPFTHTGVLASYACSDDVTLHGGWVAGWDTGFENPDDASMFLGGLSVPIGESIAMSWMLTAGNNGTGAGDLYMNSFVFDVTLTEKLHYIFQHDLGLITNEPGVNSQWYGINQYLLYSLNDCWGIGGRFEWFRDDDGARVIVNDQGVGNAGDYYALSLGLNWKPHANVVLRPELRYDWYEGNINSGAGPFNDGANSTQFGGGIDFIVTY
jgi:hypothetical protein